MISRPNRDDPQTAVRYLADKLSSSEREGFEEHYLAHPQIVEQMELDAKLKAGLICLRDANELDRLTPAPKRLWTQLPIAIAASVLVAFVVVLCLRYLATQSVLAASAAALHRPFAPQLAPGATYKLIQTRTGSYDAVIGLAKSPQVIKLQMVLDIEPPLPAFGVTLAAIADDASTKELAMVHGLYADANGILTLYLSSVAIRPGNYQLAVFREGLPDAAPETTFVLKVVTGDASAPRGAH